MSDERLTREYIEEILDHHLGEMSQVHPGTPLKADNGEFFEIAGDIQMDNEAIALVSWLIPELGFESLKAKHEPPPPPPPT